jgi:glycosyltransferase involved in cell wall biosynthesis
VLLDQSAAWSLQPSRLSAKACPQQVIVMYANTDWYLYNFRTSLARKIQSLGYSVLMISPPGAYGPRLRQMGFRWEPVEMERRSLRPDVEALVLWRLVRLFRREAPCIIHSFTIKCVLYGSLAGFLAQVPSRINAVTGLGYVFTSRDRKAQLLARALSLLMRFAMVGGRTRVIVQNHDDKDTLVRIGAPETNLRLIAGSGVDCERFFPRPQRGRGASRPRKILYCGRLLWDKGLAELVGAAGILRGRGLEFIAAGAPDPGNPAAIPAETIQEWQAEGLVRFLGHVEDMRALYADADIFVLPSYREGLPKSLIEAAACGLPLIATEVPGCKDVITNGQDGLLIPPRSASALATAIWRLAANPDLARKLGAASREKALRCFDEKLVIKQTLDVYEELIPDFALVFSAN